MDYLDRLPDKDASVDESKEYNIVFITCPKCGNKGLMSIYLPMCTDCANKERRKSGEIKDV